MRTRRRTRADTPLPAYVSRPQVMEFTNMRTDELASHIICPTRGYYWTRNSEGTHVVMPWDATSYAALRNHFIPGIFADSSWNL